MIFKNLCVIVFRTKVASALEGLKLELSPAVVVVVVALPTITNSSCKCMIKPCVEHANHWPDSKPSLARETYVGRHNTEEATDSLLPQEGDPH